MGKGGRREEREDCGYSALKIPVATGWPEFMAIGIDAPVVCTFICCCKKN